MAMEFADKVVVVTGGGRGIGAALVARFVDLGARVCVLDLDVGGAASEGRVRHFACDVGDPVQMRDTLTAVEQEVGRIDICVSNAGILSSNPQDLGDLEDWARCWSVNVMAHVHAAQVLLPGMIARGSGHFVNIASAAGLLNQIGDAAYSATKHAAVSFAESLAITHGDEGIGVTVVCPQYVATSMIGLADGDSTKAAGLLSADDVAACAIEAMEQGRFLALPHPQVQGYAAMRAQDHDAWIKGMQRLRNRAVSEFGKAGPQEFYKLF